MGEVETLNEEPDESWRSPSEFHPASSDVEEETVPELAALQALRLAHAEHVRRSSEYNEKLKSLRDNGVFAPNVREEWRALSNAEREYHHAVKALLDTTPTAADLIRTLSSRVENSERSCRELRRLRVEAQDEAVAAEERVSEVARALRVAPLRGDEIDVRGECFGVKFGEEYAAGGRIVSLCVYDDENWFPKTSFNSHWLPDVADVVARTRARLQPRTERRKWRATDFLLRLVGRKVIPRYMGVWYLNRDGEIAKRVVKIGWRLVRLDHPEEPETELERFIAESRVCDPQLD